MANKKSNSGKYIKIVIAVVLIIAAVFGIYYLFLDKNNVEENETISEIVSISTTEESAKSTSANKITETVSQNVSVSTSSNTSSSQQANNYELPLSINQAMDALEERYGNEYDVNSTIEEDGINYFALYKNDEKYASVAVNLMTGEATETILETNQKTDFHLV